MNQDIFSPTDTLKMKLFYHGTRAELKPGDLIEPSHSLDVGEQDRTTPYVYLSPNLDAAIWEAELAIADGPSRVYRVEPTGQLEDTSDLIDHKSPGHPSMSCRSREPLRVTGEITDWQGHSPEGLNAMKDGLERLERLGVEPMDD